MTTVHPQQKTCRTDPLGDAAAALAHEALLQLASRLKAEDYRFVTVTPETQRRVLARRAGALAVSPRDIWGWNLPFAPGALPPDLHAALESAGFIVRDGALWRSRIRFSTLADHLFLHSGYPTLESDAVFFGPDTHRFVSLVRDEIERRGARASRLLDVGCGSGAGGLVAAALLGRLGGADALPPRVELVDVNARALSMAAINASISGVAPIECRQADLFAGTRPGLDLIIANPPYLLDAEQRLYRHGGGSLGFDLSRRIVAEGIPLLAAGGRLVLYTGVPIIGGSDPFREAVERWTRQDGLATRYWEIDPDVFGEELDQPGYREADRIAAVALVVTRSGGESP